MSCCRLLSGLASSVLLAMNVAGQNLPERFIPENVSYFWQVTPIAHEAEILTLFAFRANGGTGHPEAVNVPVLSILRDTLGDPTHETDRLRYVWLLSSQRPGVKQEVLSAIPFFHWRIPSGTSKSKHLAKPLIDLGDPTGSLKRNLWRQVIARSVSLISALEIRTLPRQYLTNHSDHTRARLEQAISILRQAPHSEATEPLSKNDLERIIARLTLSKETFGGLISNSNLLNVARAADMRRETSRLRNLELLRSSADRLGLYFEPLLDRTSVAGQGARYGLLWSPIHGPKSEPGASVDKTWQLLQISNPNHDRRLAEMAEYAQIRSLDNNGRLLPRSQISVSTIQLVPVALYSLSYPRVPLLLMDFFHPNRIRRRELSQQLLKDASSATLYFSWVPSLGLNSSLALYHFIKDRQGFVVNEQKRLDSYSEARVDLAFDCCLDSAFRSDVQSRLAGIRLNPLDSTIAEEIASANISYRTLLGASGPSGTLLQQLDKDRREEIAATSASKMTVFRDRLFHYSTLGSYTRRAPAGPNIIELTRYTRKQQNLITFLTQVTSSGTRPEVTYDPKKIEAAVQQLSALSITAKPEVNAVFQKLARELLTLSSNEQIRLQCSRILAPASPRHAAENEEIAGSAEPVVATQ